MKIQSVEDFYIEFAPSFITWGSDEVIKLWADFRKVSAKSDLIATLESFENFSNLTSISISQTEPQTSKRLRCSLKNLTLLQRRQRSSLSTTMVVRSLPAFRTGSLFNASRTEKNLATVTALSLTWRFPKSTMKVTTRTSLINTLC